MKKSFKVVVSLSLKLYLVFLFTAACNKMPENKKEKKQELGPLKNEITTRVSEFELSMQKQGLVNLQIIDSTILVDLKYSHTDNFFGEDVYGILENAYLQKEPALAIKKANKIIGETNHNLRLIIYDAARPLRIQKILWNKLDSFPPKKRKDFVADPSEGSIHNYGCAVDLSIFDLKTNQALDMGTKYDYFGYLAYPRLEKQMLNEGKLTFEQVENRRLLRNVMKAAAFEAITSEWWHFNFYSRKKSKELYEVVE
jgi:D-alanyl-D-alanine dipeptidase